MSTDNWKFDHHVAETAKWERLVKATGVRMD